MPGGSAIDPMLLTLNNGRYPTDVEMGILGTILPNTIINGGSEVNVLSEETWKQLGQSTL